jgi:hypothetical protein
MTNLEFHLKRMLVSLESLLKQAEGLPYEEFLRGHLIAAQVEVQRQLTNELGRQLKSGAPEGV